MNGFTLSDFFYTIVVIIACLAIGYGPVWLGIAIVSIAVILTIRSMYIMSYLMLEDLEKMLLCNYQQQLAARINKNNTDTKNEGQ